VISECIHAPRTRDCTVLSQMSPHLLYSTTNQSINRLYSITNQLIIITLGKASNTKRKRQSAIWVQYLRKPRRGSMLVEPQVRTFPLVRGPKFQTTCLPRQATDVVVSESLSVACLVLPSTRSSGVQRCAGIQQSCGSMQAAVLNRALDLTHWYLLSVRVMVTEHIAALHALVGRGAQTTATHSLHPDLRNNPIAAPTQLEHVTESLVLQRAPVRQLLELSAEDCKAFCIEKNSAAPSVVFLGGEQLRATLLDSYVQFVFTEVMKNAMQVCGGGCLQGYMSVCSRRLCTMRITASALQTATSNGAALANALRNDNEEGMQKFCWCVLSQQNSTLIKDK